MSDSDADDSGFDREAERERLREKYEREQEDREQTERMSELLLQGATMTNKHCDRCNNPIFRYNGQEFCAVCQQPSETTDPDTATQHETGTAAASQPDSTPSQTDADDESQGIDQSTTVTEATGHSPRFGSGDAPTEHRPTDLGDGDIATARASLTNTLTAMANRAEASDDVRRTQEYLAAAREAAEALVALDDLR